MYHIKKDKRTQKSSELIYEGLIKCLETKDFTKITISDIEKYSTVSRATFYRLFDSLEDILSMKCDYCFKEVLENYKKNRSTNTRLLSNVLFILFIFKNLF